jgi:phosphoribosylamine--glycine ligase/phosphoribosylformylglycinamidine cyclo-ligase
MENAPRMLPDHLAAEIDVSTWCRPQIFNWLQEAGKVSPEEMSRTFNNGIGMVLAVSHVASGEVIKILKDQGEEVYRIGKLVDRDHTTPGCVLKHLDSWANNTETM